MNRKLFFILLALLLTPAVSASIAWNGEYWLIGWGGANDPHTDQRREIDLVKFDESNYTFLSLGKPASIGKITWAKDYWLIVVHPQPRPEVSFVKYNGANFTRLPVEWMHLSSMVWNGEYFLLGGSIAKREKGWVPVIFKYDGINITQLPFPFTEVTSPIEPSHISEIGWNGEYWLISENIGRSAQTSSTTETDQLEEKKRRAAQPPPPVRLVKYEGKSFSDLGELEDFINLRHIVWNGNYWLLGGDDMFKAKLVRYDGKIFTDLSSFLDGTSGINTLVWNGKYWLIGGNSKGMFKKYDGATFTDLKTLAGFSDDEYIISTVWNGEYWLIATGKTEPYGRRLLKYDGSSFTDLTLGLKNPIEIRDMVWNGKHWLIEEFVPVQDKFGQRYIVVKYDGKAFVDLTPQIEAALRPSPTIASKVPTETNVSMPTVSPKPERASIDYKLALVLVAVLLIGSVYIWRKKKR